MGLSVLAHISPIGIDDGSGVVEHPRLLFLKNGNHHHHLILLRKFLHPLDDGTGNGFRCGIPFCILTGTEIRSAENFLKAKNLNALLSRILNEGDVFLNNSFLNFINRSVSL